MPKTRYNILNDLNDAVSEFPYTAAITQILEDIQNHVKRGTYKKDFEAAGFDHYAHDDWTDYIDEEAETILDAIYKAENRLEFLQKEVQDAFKTQLKIKR